MKHHLLHQFMLKAVLCLSAIFTLHASVHAQFLVGCSTPEVLYGNLTSSIYQLNADMIQLQSGQLEVAAWDLAGVYPTSGVNIVVRNQATGTSATQFIPSRGESQPDIVWATNPAVPNTYFLAVTYLDVNAYVYLNTYKVTVSPLGVINIAFNTSTQITSTRGFFPHIDMLPDYNILYNGFPSLHRFAITYGTSTSSTTVDVQEVHGDISAPGTLSPISTLTSGGAYSGGSDVGVSYDPSNQREHIYVAYSDGSDLNVTELIMAYGAGPTATPIIWPTTNLVSGGWVLPFIRIDAMGNNQVNSGTIVPWVIAASLNGGEPWAFDTYGGLNLSSGLLPTDYNICPAVAAGPGVPFGPVCNNNYNVGWYNTSKGYMTMVIDAFTGMVSTTYPDYYIANYNMIYLPGGVSKIPIALSSCSNSGNYLFTGFWDGGSQVYFQFKMGISNYKPGHTTGVGNVANSSTIKVYPNPASDKLNITGLKTSTYSIINIVGQTVKTGIIDKDNFEINVASFVNGNYILSIRNEEGNQMVPFVKQ